MGSQASAAGEYTEPQLPDGVLEVRLSVYKIRIFGEGILSSVGAGIAGAYHSGVVVAGKEWAFGGHGDQNLSGVYKTAPEMNRDYDFYTRIILGRIRMSSSDIEAKIKGLARSPEWSGPTYNLTTHNCNHFASDLCWLLLRRRPPAWVNRTSEELARPERRKRVEEEALQDALAAYRSEHAVTISAESTHGARPPPGSKEAATTQRDAPGARAFQDAFSKTFDLAWNKHWEAGRPRLGDDVSEEGEDTEELMSQAELDALDLAKVAATIAAVAVAAAARAAAASRAEQPPAGLSAWDQAWASESGKFLPVWRRQAVAGELTGKANDEARDLQTAAALAVAAEAAKEAASTAEAAVPPSPDQPRAC